MDPNAIVGSNEFIQSLSESELTRFRRNAGYTRGRYDRIIQEMLNKIIYIKQNRSHRGQTQSQYLNFGDTDSEGKAEAEATSHGSRAVVGK